MGKTVKLVKFKDGTWGVRKQQWLGGYFADLRPGSLGDWWPHPIGIHYCRGSEERAREVYQKLTDMGKEQQ